MYSIGLRSPSGDMLNRIPVSLNRSVRRFYFENTTVIVEYYTVEPHTGDPLILVSFENPSPGHWYLDIYGNGDNASSGFHIWIPMSGFLKESTQLSELTELEDKNMETTLTSPSDSLLPISVTAYDHQNNNILSIAGRGYTRNKAVKPDLAAPGVSILCPTIGNDYELRSGTSIAAAETTGVVAMILEWGIVRKNKPFMNGIEIKQFLLDGVKKSENRTYPNAEWGYGILDIYGSFSHPWEQ